MTLKELLKEKLEDYGNERVLTILAEIFSESDLYKDEQISKDLYALIETHRR